MNFTLNLKGQNFHFWVNYPFKNSLFILINNVYFFTYCLLFIYIADLNTI